MDLIGNAQGMIWLVLSLAIFAMQVFAFADALRHRPESYVAAGKRTKTIWMVITGVAVLLGFLTLGARPDLLTFVGIVGSGVYLADVRPALKSVSGGPRRRHDSW